MEIILNGQAILDKATLHQQLKEQGKFPDYYGNNLDALYDVLSTGTWHIMIKHLDALDTNLKEYSLYFFDVLSDLKEDNPDFTYEVIAEEETED